MTLGMAARSSASSETGAFSHGGANSLMKIAAPTLSGTAISKARKEETRVPKRKGSAPNCSRTGSQVPVTRNEVPNFRRAGIDSRSSTANRRTARKRTTDAKKADAFSKTRSFVIFPDRAAMDQYRG